MQPSVRRNVGYVVAAVVAAVAVFGCGGAEREQSFTAVGNEQTVRGTVVNTELTACGRVEGKPGTCEGTMVVQPAGSSEADRVVLQVTRDVTLKKGDEAVLLPSLQGSVVDARYVATKEGSRLATSVVATR